MTDPRITTREILVLAGPTAVGKSALAVEVARAVGGEIVSADSRQLYRGLNIGTATPTEPERRGVPHHLLGVLDPDQPVSAGWYQAQARRAIAGCWERGRPAVVVGGSTLYVHALIAGLSDLPDVPAETARQLAAEVREPGGAMRLYQELLDADPDAAATLDPSKTQRLARLVGVSRTADIRVSELWRDGAAAALPSRLVVLDRPRPDLYARIDARVDAMMASGLERELADVLERWPEAEGTLRATIGYRELLTAADEERPLHTAVEAVKRNSRRYAKRQLTWYRRYPDAQWMDTATATPEQVLRAVGWPPTGPSTPALGLPPIR